MLFLDTQVCVSVVLPHLCPNFHLTRKLHTFLSTFYPALDQNQDLSTFTTALSAILHSELISQIFLLNTTSVILLFKSTD